MDPLTPKELVKHFCNEYQLKTGLKFVPVWKREITIIKQILETISSDELFKCISSYFDLYNERYNLLFFKYKINDILAYVSQRKTEKMQNNDNWRFTQ